MCTQNELLPILSTFLYKLLSKWDSAGTWANTPGCMSQIFCYLKRRRFARECEFRPGHIPHKSTIRGLKELRSDFVSHLLVVEVFPLKNLCHHLNFLWTADLNPNFHGQNNCQGSNKSKQAKQNAALWHVCFKSLSEVKYSFNKGSKVPWQMARSTFVVPWAPLTFWYFYHTGISTDPTLSPVLWTGDCTSTARRDTVSMEFLLTKTHHCTY